MSPKAPKSSSVNKETASALMESAKTEFADPNGNSSGPCPGCGKSGAKNWLQAPDRFHQRSQPYALLRCPSCSLVWLQDPPAPSEMGRHYGEAYDRAIARAGQDFHFWARRRDTILGYKSGGSVLDLGCNSGGFLASMRGPSWKLFGIEMSERAAREAEARCDAHVFVGDILDAPFPPESFDVITCFHVLEHVYQPKDLLAKVNEWLKPGGIFYAEMPNIDSAGLRIFRSYWYALELPRHLYHYSPTTVRTLTRQAGLLEVSLTTRRYVCIEGSIRYFTDDVFKKIGIRRTAMAQLKDASLPWRVVRKAFRSTILPVLDWLASFAGDGGCIFAIFAKNGCRIQ